MLVQVRGHFFLVDGTELITTRILFNFLFRFKREFIELANFVHEIFTCLDFEIQSKLEFLALQLKTFERFLSFSSIFVGQEIDLCIHTDGRDFDLLILELIQYFFKVLFFHVLSQVVDEPATAARLPFGLTELKFDFVAI